MRQFRAGFSRGVVPHFSALVFVVFFKFGFAVWSTICVESAFRQGIFPLVLPSAVESFKVIFGDQAPGWAPAALWFHTPLRRELRASFII